MGYGNGTEATVVNFGPDPNQKFITTYFRKTVNMVVDKTFTKYILEINRDDGAVVYINGVLRWRSNMPSGTITNTTLASSVAVDDGNLLKAISLSPSCFVSGLNVIAVEVHQANASDGDLKFDLRLSGNKAPVAIAGSDVTLPANTTEFLLNGSQSYDPDGRIRKYRWTKISGPDGDSILNPTAAQTKVIRLKSGLYTYQLKVTDNAGSFATDEIALTVSNPSMLFVDWKTITLPSDGLPDARRFANDKLRSSTAYDPFGKTIVDGKMRFIVDSQVPVDPAISSAKYHYRAEFTEWPWNINLPEGTEQWVGWSYYFPNDYVLPVNPVSIFQNHAAGTYPYPIFQLEIARPGQLSGALGGEIQVINNTLTPSFRKLTTVRPMPGDRLDVVIHVVYGLGNKGLLQIWLNGQKVHDVVSSTVYPAPENWGGNNKWGIYHHAWRNPTSVEQSIAAGHTKFELFMGNLRQITRAPGDADYLFNYKTAVDPSQDADLNQPTKSARLATQYYNVSKVETENELKVYPIPVRAGENLFVSGSFDDSSSADLINQTGQLIRSWDKLTQGQISLDGLAPGVYILKVNCVGKIHQRRITLL